MRRLLYLVLLVVQIGIAAVAYDALTARDPYMKGFVGVLIAAFVAFFFTALPIAYLDLSAHIRYWRYIHPILLAPFIVLAIMAAAKGEFGNAAMAAFLGTAFTFGPAIIYFYVRDLVRARRVRRAPRALLPEQRAD